MNPKLVGTWFLVRNRGNGELMVTKADKVVPSKFMPGSFMAEGMKSGWMNLSKDGRIFNTEEYADITREDFTSLRLPRVTYENSPLEIEIMPSGEVYFY